MTVFELPDVLRNAPGMRAAQLLMDGLGVLCFNKTNLDDRFWEIAYPRKAHYLTIKVQELNGADRRVGRPIRRRLRDEIRSFNISLTNGSVDHYNHFPFGGPRTIPFNRHNPRNDPHDLSWMIDLAGPELHHTRFNGLRRGRPISLARIRHSLFCTLEPEEDDVKIALRDDNDPDAGTVLGRTNTEIVGVLLAKDSGEIRFESDPAGLINIGPLAYGPDKRYQIDIINEDNKLHLKKKNFVRGDLRLFYEEVIDAHPVRDLWARPAPPRKRVAPDGDCHLPDYGGESLEELIQLETTESINRRTNNVPKKSSRGTSRKARSKSVSAKLKKAAKKRTKRTLKRTARKSTKGRSKKAAKRSTKARSGKTTKNPTKARSKKSVARRRLRRT